MQFSERYFTSLGSSNYGPHSSILIVICLLSTLFAVAAANAETNETTSSYASCRMTKQALDGDINGATSPDNVCLDEFGEGWVFAAPRLDAVFALPDLVRIDSGTFGWCKHAVNNCSDWTSSKNTSDATVCTIARRPMNNTGILGMRSREQCNQRHPFWCCKEKPEGGLQ